MFLGLLLAAYLIGSFPTALIVGKLFFHVDIRDHGSKNPGATNSLRVFGKKTALLVLIIDVGKGAIAAFLPLYFHLPIDPLYFGLTAAIGHCFPIFAGFKGGKAIATTAGTLMVANFPLFLITYLIFFLIIFFTKYVFFGSLSIGLSLILYSFITHSHEYKTIFLFFFLILIYVHRSNIRNFILGIEPKIDDPKMHKDRIPP
ncbi:MAG TPA: glycerol-3-phosphate 1-O-acyltransferase PlsY, partial [Bacillales bacterium]|nr:glycerol-3-phosphate 1-O-acyltransferase PlsY [Bacillales bacterium]